MRESADDIAIKLVRVSLVANGFVEQLLGRDPQESILNLEGEAKWLTGTLEFEPER